MYSLPIRTKLSLVLSAVILKEDLGVKFSEPSVLLMNDGEAILDIKGLVEMRIKH